MKKYDRNIQLMGHQLMFFLKKKGRNTPSKVIILH